MKPYYEDDFVRLYHGDCLEHPEWWTDADVLVTDPPYGMGYQGFGGRKGEPRRNTGRLSIAGDGGANTRDEMLNIWDQTKPTLVFGKWTIERPKGTKARLVWNKLNTVGMGDITLPWGPADEEIYVLGGGFVGKRGTNVLGIQPLMSSDADRPDHPTPKPVALMEMLIEKCPPGTIADPFAGSGSTLVAAKRLGRKAIGVELEEKYCEIAARRLSQGVLELWEVGA